MNVLKERFYVHGLWPHMNGFAEDWKIDYSIPNLEKFFDEQWLELSKVLDEYQEDLLSYWPNLRHPTDIQHCRKFVFHEWRTHGFPAGIDPRMYVIYGLELRKVIPYNFGITVGETLDRWKAANQAKEVMKNLVLFGEHIGADVYPELKCDWNLYNQNGPLYIQEVRPSFIRFFNGNEAKVMVTQAKPFSGVYGPHLILPSKPM